MLLPLSYSYRGIRLLLVYTRSEIAFLLLLLYFAV